MEIELIKSLYSDCHRHLAQESSRSSLAVAEHDLDGQDGVGRRMPGVDRPHLLLLATFARLIGQS